MEPGEIEHADLKVTRLDEPEQPPPKPIGVARWSRTRSGRLTLSALCALLVLGALVGLIIRVTPDPAGAFASAFGLPTATPTAPILLGGDTFIVSDMVPWGTLTIDGRRLTLTEIGDLGAGFVLKRGIHHLVYQAQDFPTLRCVISVPGSTSDTCPKATNVPGANSAAFERFLDLRATPDHLPGPAYESLVAAVDAKLATTTETTTIQPGERYYSQTGALATARTPMTFTMGVEPAKGDMGDCQLEICEFGDGAGARPGWQLESFVTPTWTITTATGATFTSAIPQSQRFPVSIGFHATPAGSGWQAQVDGANPLAEVVSSTASGALESEWGPVSQDTGMEFGQLANSADGAVLQVVHGGATVPPVGVTPGPVQSAEAEVLWRFGVLLTVNSEAQREFPHLLVALPAERTLAQAATFLGY